MLECWNVLWVLLRSSCFNLFMLHNNSFDNQGSEINKNDLPFDILSLYIYIYIYIYIKTVCWNVKKCLFIWRSYRKLAWVGFEPTTTEFRSDALTDWAIRPWVQLALRANFFTATPISWLVQCHISFRLFIFVICHVYLIKVFCRWSHECCGMSWYIWYSPLTDSLK